MVSELIINARKNIYRIALLKNNELVEYHVDEKDNHFSVGDIYLGVVKKIIPGLNAAFINIGYEKDAFLHYLDLGLQFNSINKFFIARRWVGGDQLHSYGLRHAVCNFISFR